MHVERYGYGGPAVVLLHGFGTSSFLWRYVAPQLAEAGYTAFVPDLFGYGESDRPFDADFGIAAQADYVDRAMTALRVARATVVGVDLGAAVALRLATHRPERVERLVLVNPMPLDEFPGRDIRTLQRNTARFALRLTRGMFGAAPLLLPLLEGSVAAPEHMPERLAARYLAPYVGREGVTHLLALARAIRAEELEDVEPAEVRAPALVVRGEEDGWTDDRSVEKIAGALTGSRMVRLAGVARLVPEEAPERLAEEIASFARASDTVEAG